MTMKLKAEDILKPGAVLETKLIDFKDPANAKIVAAYRLTRMRQNKLNRLRKWDPKVLDLVINI